MPVTKTAKRALRVSTRKAKTNATMKSRLESMIRVATRSKAKKDIKEVFSLADRAAKVNLIHKNKAARIKSRFALITKTK